jgi:Lar family restriction alleviation protein
MSTPPTITPCPFCGDTAPATDQVKLNVWAVVCDICGCIGPIEDPAEAEQSPERAIELWNRRPVHTEAKPAPAWVRQYGIKV